MGYKKIKIKLMKTKIKLNGFNKTAAVIITAEISILFFELSSLMKIEKPYSPREKENKSTYILYP